MADTKIILAAVSSYGTMADPRARYRVMIKAGDRNELIEKFGKFILSEAERALADAEIMEDLEELDRDNILKDLDLTEVNPEVGRRDIVTVDALLTDYHIEYEVCDADSPLARTREVILMTDHDKECGADGEFGYVTQFIPIEREEEQRHGSDMTSVELPGGTISGTDSEVMQELLCWDRHVLPVV